ncbi:MAG TPA: GNAT family N-acetyltransferase [Rhodanobacter sp.]|nr:GNAT family N-acetyltransferase [Rhodanobacter sp.]
MSEEFEQTYMGSFNIIAATKADYEILWRFLAIAANESAVEAAKAIPVVAVHLAGWQGENDFGFLARDGEDVIGAAWARQFLEAEMPSFFVDHRTPEVSIGVLPTHRGKGVGRRLLESLIGEAEKRRIGLCLNVRDDNPAMRLYEKLGFRLVHGFAVHNRVGGVSFGMVIPRFSGNSPQVS